VEHPAFREIISLGTAVVPLMLRDLQERPRLWVWALPEITGADPVPPGERGNIANMSEAWLRWGRAHGYQCYMTAHDSAAYKPEARAKGRVPSLALQACMLHDPAR
jgi:hypothetical protein